MTAWQRLQRQSRQEQRALQDALLRRYVREYLFPFSPHYRDLLQKSGVRPEQINGVDDLRRIPETIVLSQRTHRLLWQNIGFALGVKLVFLVLALFGEASMWMAVFADMGASLIVVFNGLRILR